MASGDGDPNGIVYDRDDSGRTHDERISTTDVCRTCGRTRIEHGTGSPEYMLACVGTGYQSHYRRGFAPASFAAGSMRGRPLAGEAAGLGLGPDAPATANAAGGKQSATPYRCDLLPPHAALAVSRVLSEGAAKYGPNNWHKIPVADHLNHAIAHVFADLAGDTSDAHLDHAATRLLFALDQRRSGREGGAA
ncbi:MAG: dATP/dGTP diphosphohydrolase domain-containing protein [Chloroflexota bacterium]